MYRQHLETLVDPVDGSRLTSVGSDEDVTEGVLSSEGGRKYAITRGIPRFVPNDAYVRSFSFEWLTHARTQVDEHDDESLRTFVEKTGFDEPLMRGATVLDVGVGSGRFADAALKLGAASVYGLDLSMAVESAWRNLQHDRRFTCVQGDVFAPPFRTATFDLIYSIGVLHHTPAPRAAFERLVPLLKPGGRIAIYVYPRTPTHVVSDALRIVTTRVAPERLHQAISKVQPVLDRISDTSVGFWLLRWLPRSDSHRRDWRILDTFDWYSPHYQFKYSGFEEICDWFREAGLVDVRPLPYPICIQGRKPY